VTITTYDLVPTVLGELLLTDAGEGLNGVYFPDHRRGRGPHVQPDWRRDPDRFVTVRAQLLAYLDGRRRSFDLPLAPTGTPRQRQVWHELANVPYGTTVTYGALAAAVDRPTAARSVASAVGANPLSIVVPCHRVVGADGSLTGYAGGLDRKRHLLELERVASPV
jgi:methylated-DNA-[protein]-cysteine S-methyltransferase